MRPVALLVFVVACNSAEPGDADAPTVILDVDVAVDNRVVEVYPRELDRPCHCASNWPAPGTCTYSTDEIQCLCAPPPASCVDRVELVALGEVIATRDYVEPRLGSVQLSLEDLPAAPDAIAIEGCGSRATIPLYTTGTFPIPRIHELTTTESELTIHWTATPVGTSSVAWRTDGFVADICHDDDFDGVDTLPYYRGGVYRHWGALRTLTTTVHATELGEVRVWTGGSAKFELPPE